MDFLVIVEQRISVRGFIKFVDVGLGDGGDAVQRHGWDYR